MSGELYTPDTDEVRTAATANRRWAWAISPAEFDRWLASHDAEVVRDAMANMNTETPTKENQK